jgi:hypothetical protein
LDNNPVEEMFGHLLVHSEKELLAWIAYNLMERDMLAAGGSS